MRGGFRCGGAWLIFVSGVLLVNGTSVHNTVNGDGMLLVNGTSVQNTDNGDGVPITTTRFQDRATLNRLQWDSALPTPEKFDEIQRTRLQRRSISRRGYKNNRSSIGYAVKGLPNFGNTCYINAVLQCLKNLKPFAEVFGDKNFVGSHRTDSASKGMITRGFAVLLGVMMNDGNVMEKHKSLKFFREVVNGLNNQFEFGQQDAHEFMKFLLDTIHEETKTATSTENTFLPDQGGTQTAQEYADLVWHEYMKQHEGLISKMFVGQMQETKFCGGCSRQSHRFQQFWDYQLRFSTKKKSKITFKEILEESTKAEKIEDYKCPGCTEKGLTEMSQKLFRLPQILVIHFVRFQPSFTDDSFSSHVKDNIDVEFEKCGMSLEIAYSDDMPDESRNTIYDISGIILHEGEHHGGHYKAQSLDWKTNTWYEYNDESVKEIVGPDLSGNEPYILFYVRRDRDNSQMNSNSSMSTGLSSSGKSPIMSIDDISLRSNGLLST